MQARPGPLLQLGGLVAVLLISAPVQALETAIQSRTAPAGPTQSDPFLDDGPGPSNEELSAALGQKQMGDISADDAQQEQGRVPGDAFSETVGTPEIEGCFVASARGFAHQHFHWNASGLLHQPLYFEDVPLERYGHTHILQPAVSGLKFFATVPILPYKMGVNLPRECVYSLGYDRPGDCACPVKEHLPFSLRGAILQAGAATGITFLFP